jgi:hypothetical protein
LGGLIFGDYKTGKGLESSFKKTKKGLIINWENDNFKYYQSVDGKNNMLAINSFNDFEKKNFRLVKRNKLFIRFPMLFLIYQKIEKNKMKIHHFLFAYQNNPFNRLKHKIKK